MYAPATSPPISTITSKRFLQKLITYRNMILQRVLQPYWLQVGWRSDYQFCQFDHTCMECRNKLCAPFTLCAMIPSLSSSAKRLINSNSFSLCFLLAFVQLSYKNQKKTKHSLCIQKRFKQLSSLRVWQQFKFLINIQKKTKKGLKMTIPILN